MGSGVQYRQRWNPWAIGIDKTLMCWLKLLRRHVPCSLFPVQIIGKVYRRWLPVLDLIKLDNRGNRFVESLRGKLTDNPMAKDNEEDAAFATQVADLKEKLIK